MYDCAMVSGSALFPPPMRRKGTPAFTFGRVGSAQRGKVIEMVSVAAVADAYIYKNGVDR